MILLVIQVLLTLCAVAMSVLAGRTLLGAVGLGLLGASAITAQLAPGIIRHKLYRLSIGLALVAGLAVPVTFWRARDVDFASVEQYWQLYCALLGWLTATCILPVSYGAAQAALAPRWRRPLLGTALLATFLWVGTAYVQNFGVAFHLALLALLAVLLLWKAWFQVPWVGTQVLNTVILLLLFLPVTDQIVRQIRTRAEVRATGPGVSPYWTYRAAKAYPATYSRWWLDYVNAWGAVWHTVVNTNPGAGVPLALRPGAKGQFMRCPLLINSQGFRGPEIPAVKGNTYRIVALGESTTFGWTTRPQDKPWPELFAQLVRERLKPARPIEVINAGVPGATLLDNLLRLPNQILPLKPDLILSYHGVNGFYLLDPSIPTLRGQAYPRYCERPLKLLGDCEYHFKELLYRRKVGPMAFRGSLALTNLLQTKYAQGYRQLIELARTHHIRLALANFSLAVNEHSPPEVVEFYRETAPAVHAYIQANAAHSRLVAELARAYPEVRLVDSHPHLDGDTEKFFDVVHFDPDGDQQLAENFFAGVKDILQADLAGK